MNRTKEEVAALVQAALNRITDPDVRSELEAVLVEPYLVQASWDYGEPGEMYPCWIIAEHRASDTGLAFSDDGFGPKLPWGLILPAEPSFGMDSGWFPNLGRAFAESFAAVHLKIWNLVRIDQSGETEILASSLTYDDAYARTKELKPAMESPRYRIEYPLYRIERRKV